MDLFLHGKKLQKGIVLRSLPLYIAALGIALIWHPQVWMVCLLFFATSLLSLFLILQYIKQQYSTGPLEEHPLEPTLRIAKETLPYLRQGLNQDTAAKTAEIIQKLTDVAAVAITDQQQVLAYIGVGADHHKAGGPILTDATKMVLSSGELKIIDSRYGLSCPEKDCPLESAVIAPLKVKGEVAGTVKLYQTKREVLSPNVVKLVNAVAQLLSLQMELAQLDRQVQLVTKAELDALQSQINPHFLFNTLNTIIMFIRTNPETARRLLIRLAAFFRHALKRHGYFNSLKEEIEYLNTYIILEKARYRDKIRIVRELDENLFDYQVPVLTIQPLVENAIKHGILPKEGMGTVRIKAFIQEKEIFFEIKDNGVGIPAEKLPLVLKPGYGSGNGVGMSNVHERLKGLFGEEYGLNIESVPDQYTMVRFKIPLLTSQEEGIGQT